VLEAEPPVGAQLRADGLRALVGAGIAGLLFLVFAIALRRESQRREEVLLQAHRDRRLAALGEMSAVVAHELRNPLASLKGHTQLMLELLPANGSEEATAATERVRKKAERIVQDAEELQALTSSLLAFVRSGELQPQAVDFRRIVERAAEVAGGATLRLPDFEVNGQADPGRLEQAISNLIQNAWQASAARPEVELRLLGPAGPTEHSGKTVEVRVMDHGPGIDLSSAESLFEPFHTTRAQGTGLGLAIAKSIVDAHHGTLHAENRPEGGALFLLRLPRWGQG
jgi:two-component system sensor histidine kinase HydH